MNEPVERLISYILDDRVKRFDRDVLRSMAQAARDDAKDEPEEDELHHQP